MTTTTNSSATALSLRLLCASHLAFRALYSAAEYFPALCAYADQARTSTAANRRLLAERVAGFFDALEAVGEGWGAYRVRRALVLARLAADLHAALERATFEVTTERLVCGNGGEGVTIEAAGTLAGGRVVSGGAL